MQQSKVAIFIVRFTSNLSRTVSSPTVVVGLQTRRGYPSSRYGALARNHSMAPGVLSHPGSASAK